MGDEDTNLSRNEWMTYIQDIWMDGVYNPDTWNIFGHRSDFTNNAQEAYNAVLNRLVQVAHPSILSLIQMIVKELNYNENILGRIGAGHLGKGPKRTQF